MTIPRSTDLCMTKKKKCFYNDTSIIYWLIKRERTCFIITRDFALYKHIGEVASVKDFHVVVTNNPSSIAAPTGGCTPYEPNKNIFIP